MISLVRDQRATSACSTHLTDEDVEACETVQVLRYTPETDDERLVRYWFCSSDCRTNFVNKVESGETWERHVIRSVDEVRVGAVYETPTLERTNSKAWEVGIVDSYEIAYTKVSGSSGELIGWDDNPGIAGSDENRSMRELVEDGEIVEIEPL